MELFRIGVTVSEHSREDSKLETFGCGETGGGQANRESTALGHTSYRTAMAATNNHTKPQEHNKRPW
jgi:hypothetical protein